MTITRTSTRRITAAAFATLAVLGSAATAAASPGRTGTSPGDEVAGSLSRLLPEGRMAGRLLGEDVTVNRAVSQLSDGLAIQPARCLSAFVPAQSEAYVSAPVSVAGKRLEGRSAYATEWVVQLASKRAAGAQLQSTGDSWSGCGGVTVSSKTSDGRTQSWELDAPRVSEDRTIITLAQREVRSGATCERAVAAYRDLFFDVMSCSTTGSSTGAAAAIVEAISQNVQSQFT